MDADKKPQREEEEQAGHQDLTERTSKTPGRLQSSHRPSINSQDSAASTDTDADISSDMDGAGDGYRRRRALLMDSLENENARSKLSRKKHGHRYRNASGASDEENKQLVYTSDDGHGSDFSSRTTSDDFELDHLTTEGPLSDDAETGMMKKDQKRRKRRRRKAARMDERFAGSIKASKPNRKFTYREMYQAWLINALLVASWYAFSLSISIVSEQGLFPRHLLIFRSTTNGCSRPNTWISIFLFTLHACI